MRARSVAIGCLGLPLIVVVIGALLALVAVLMGPPESHEVSRNLDQPVSNIVLPDSANSQATQEELLSGAALLTVHLEFEEGEFEVRPAGVGESIRIDADYEEGLFKLTPEFSKSGDHEKFNLKFEKIGVLSTVRQLIHSRGMDIDNKIVVFLPSGVPIDLTIIMRKGECRVDLTELAIRNLDVDAAMGETSVVFSEPNPIILERLNIKAKMGEVTFRGLGYASVRDLILRGKMGEFKLGMDGPWKVDVNADVNVMMGEAVISVPGHVIIQGGHNRAMFGEIDMPPRDSFVDPERDGETRVLTFKSSVTFGSISVR